MVFENIKIFRDVKELKMIIPKKKRNRDEEYEDHYLF